MENRPHPSSEEARSEWIRGLILNDFAKRCSRNPRYSMRRYAQSLGISHALLSLVLNGKRKPSRELALRTAERLGIGRDELALHFPIGASQSLNPAPKAEDSVFIRLSLEEYALISDWYFYAILSLLEIREAKWEARWIAGRLSISESQAVSAMQLLERHRIVERRRNGRWKQSSRPIKVENTVSTEVTRKAHRQLLEKALESLENDPIAVRDFSYCTFSMDENLVPLALKEIRQFRRQLMKKLEGKGRASHVYELCVQLFPVSKGSKS